MKKKMKNQRKKWKKIEKKNSKKTVIMLTTISEVLALSNADSLTKWIGTLDRR